MSKSPHPSLLYTERKRSGLTLKNVSFLIGLKTATQLGRFEQHKRVPRLVTALALEIVYGHTPKKSFKRLYESVEEEVVTRVYKLHQNVEHRTDEIGKRKARFLRSILDRATKQPKQSKV